MLNYKVAEISDKKIWEDFSLRSSPNTFLQSWAWGEFNESLGRKIWRLGVFKDGKLAAINLVICQPTRLGRYLYCPHGPIFDWKDQKIFDLLVENMKEIADNEGCIFLKIEPLLADSVQNRQIFQKRGFKAAAAFFQAENVWLLPLEASEEELLRQMRKTTRYLIRHEPDQGIKIEVSGEKKDAEKFVGLLTVTAARKAFVGGIHDKDYYLKQFDCLAGENHEKIFIAKKGQETLSMAMIIFYGEMGYYLHAASNPKNKDSVGYSLQWEAIKEAKRRGCKYYNFWGVVRDEHFQPNHPWYGFSLFKKGFGGFGRTYIRAQDYPLNWKYFLYRLAERGRKINRRLRYGYWED
ncbi:MAG: hypothetical protein A2126_03540 [Candidatus Woykebacteria bacterium GWB1_45_5]|uniref:BioF2-like acetyltransferase domain-containing protein n=2 Tax=Candidatus Woykeibacteriota TaxID=1817899 RepID=A0A1G1W3M8_9BACT|nr:MAG: hypothetical protein A2113_03305 [Candidatus Woykebacteria bacterium GWA1_44_8]OGY24493.1 MAG: hypothetical protein A2126_03540 [Candidatus Woykebacteria bacterium GWB1_45_5]